MRGSALVHTENNHEGIVAHNSGIIALLPVSERPAGVPESTYQSLLPPTTVPGLKDSTEDFLTLRYLHHRYRRGNQHKDTNAARSLRNLACRRARQTDQRNMNCVVGQQYRTANSKSTVCGRPLHPREPTVRVERLEVELHRYGRIVPTSSGSYHILDTSTPESLSEGSIHPFSENRKVVQAYCSVDDVNVAVNRVGRKPNRVTGATDRTSGVYVATSDTNITDDNCDFTSDPDGADVSSQINKTIPRSYSKDSHYTKSTHEHGVWERDLNIYAGNSNSNSSVSDAGLKHVSTDGQYFQKDTMKCWEPIYEPISDADSEPDSIKGTMPSENQVDDSVSVEHVNLHCDSPVNSADLGRHCSLMDVRKDTAECVNKRRHSAPDDPLRKNKKEEKSKRQRRWSFNTQSDMLQTDHRETVKKLYLNRLLLSKDAKIESWNVFIDIAHDEHSIEEYQFPEPPLSKSMVVKEEKEEAASAVSEHNSLGMEHSSRTSSPCSKETVCGDSPCSQFNRELNIEDEDTIEAPRVFISVPVSQVYSSRNILEELPTSDCEDGAHIPRSEPNNSVIVSSAILNEAEGKYELPSEIPGTQTPEVGVLTKSLTEKRKAESSVPAEATLPDGKRLFYALEVTEPLEYCPCGIAMCVKCEKGECVRHISCNSAESLKTHSCYNREAHYQNKNVASNNTENSREVSANIKSEVCRNSEQGVRMRVSSKGHSLGMTANDTSVNAKYGHLTADSLLDETEEVSDECSTYASTEKSLSVKSADCNRGSEEWSSLVTKTNFSNSQTDKEKLYRNFDISPLTVSPRVSPWQHAYGEESIGGKSASTGNLRSYGEPVNDLEERENENCSNDSDKEVVICENTDQTDEKPDIDTHIDSQNPADVSKRLRDNRELTDGSRDPSPPRKAKMGRRKGRIITTRRPEHDANKEASGDDSQIRIKQRAPRKLRHSRRSFRHDSIQMFKVSAAFPPQNTHVPWRYKRKKPEFLDPIDPKIVSPPSPVTNPNHTQPLFDDAVTNIDIEDDIPSPGSLTIDLGEQNTNSSELSNVEEDCRSRRQSNIEGSDGEEDVASSVRRRLSSEADSTGTKEKTHLGITPYNDQDQNQTGDMVSESSDEGQNKKKRRRAKKSKIGDASAAVNVTQNKLSAQMQEKGRRLAQELPGFNWLEEKIRNGGVTTVLPPKRVSCGSVVDPPNKSVPASETTRSVVSHRISNSVSDAARTSVPPTPSSPPEQRNSKRLQEYLLRPPKRARGSPTRVPEVGNEGQEVAPALQPTHQHTETPPAPLAVAPVSPLQRLYYPQQVSPRHIQPPRTVSEQEDSPAHNQSSRRPVIVSVSEVAKSSDVSPLLQQLTSGGELEVTLSTPSTSSSVSSDSGVVSLSSHRTSSDGEQPDVTHVSVKSMNAGNRQQYAEDRPRDASQHSSASYKRTSYAVEQLSQPHQPEPSIFPPHEHVPVYAWNREAPRWQGDAPARRVQEGGSGSADSGYSDRIATMARHAATSFDTGFGMGLAVSQEACQRVARHQQHRPPDAAHQPTTYHREHLLRPPGYLPPHVQQPGAYDFRSPQYRLCQPSYMVPQQSLKPQIVRPSAQYPVGMGPCHPSHACSQTFTAASNSQVFIPRTPQNSSSLIASHPSMFSPRTSRRKTDPSTSQTSSAVPSNHSSPVIEMASEAPQTPSSTHNQAQTPGSQNEAHASDPENRAVISDPLAKEKDPPKGIEEIRKAAEAAVEELEKLEQLKETTKKNLERLKLAEEQAMKHLARTQKQLEEAVGVHKTGKAVESKTAVPVATATSSESSKPVLYAALPKTTQERHQSHVQDTQKSSQRPNNATDANGGSIMELHVTFPAVTQENKQSAAAHKNHQLGLGCKRHQSDITQNNLQSGGAHWNKQSAFTHENHQFGAACGNQQSSDACQIQQSEAAHENHPSEAVCRNQQSAVAGENCQSGTAYRSQQSEVGRENHQSRAACKNQQLAVASENNQLENEGKSEDSVVAHDDCRSGVTCKNLPTQQKCNVTSDSTATFPAVVQANQSTRDSRDTQQKQSVSAGTTGSSVPVLNTNLETVVWEKESSGVANENSQTQQVPSCSSGSNDSSIPKLHTKIPTVKSENNLTQQKLTVSSNSTGNSLTQLNLTFQTVAHENQQSDIVCRNHEIQRKLNVSSDNSKSSVSAVNVAHPAAVQLNNQSGVVHDHQQSDNVCRDHTTRHELSATSDIRLTGNSVQVLNVNFLSLAQENQQSGFACRNQQQMVSCGQYQSAVPCESCHSVQRTSGTVGAGRSSLPGLQMAYPAVTCEKYKSEQKLNVSVSSMTRNSAPGLLTTCPTTGYQNQEAAPRPLASSSLLVRPPLHVPVSHQVTYSQSQPAPHPQGHSIVLHRHPIKGAHPPLSSSHSKFSSLSRPSVRPQLPHMPQPTLYPQLSPVSQTALKSQLLSVSQTSPHFQSSPVSQESPHSQSEVTAETSPHFHSLPKPQTAPHYESLSPHSQSLIITQKFPHLPLHHTSPNSQSLPVSQISPNSRTFPVPQTSAHVHPPVVYPASPHTQNSQLLQISHTSAHSHLSPVSQSAPQSQSLPFFQTSHSQPGVALHPPVDHQALQVPQQSPTKPQPLQVPTDELRRTANLPHSSVEMLAVQSKTMPPPPQRQNILPKPPESGGSHTPVPVLSKCTSPQATPDPITVHSVESPSDVSIITQFRSVQQSSVATQEPHAVISSTSNRLRSSTVEECPIDLSIGKQKSENEGKNKQLISGTSIVLPLCQHNEQNSHGQHSTSPRHHQGRSEIQPSVVHNLSSEEHNVTDNTGILHHNYRMPHSHTSQLQSAKNSGHQQQLQTALQMGSKVRDPVLTASVSTAGNSTGKDGLGRQHDGHRMSEPESSHRHKRFEILRDRNVDSGSVLHRRHVQVPEHHEMPHYSQHSVHQYHTHTLMPSSSHVPTYHKTVVHGLQSEQQQGNHTAELHTASAVSSRRDMYWSANKQVSSTAAVAPDQPSQDACSVAGEHSHTHSQLVCGRCNQTARFMCSACHNEWYCSSECQLRHWSYHSVDCSRQHQHEDK